MQLQKLLLRLYRILNSSDSLWLIITNGNIMTISLITVITMKKESNTWITFLSTFMQDLNQPTNLNGLYNSFNKQILSLKRLKLLFKKEMLYLQKQNLWQMNLESSPMITLQLERTTIGTCVPFCMLIFLLN